MRPRFALHWRGSENACNFLEPYAETRPRIPRVTTRITHFVFPLFPVLFVGVACGGGHESPSVPDARRAAVPAEENGPLAVHRKRRAAAQTQPVRAAIVPDAPPRAVSPPRPDARLPVATSVESAVRLGPVTVNGTLSLAEVRVALADNMDKVRLCYDRMLNISPGLRAVIPANFDVAQTGSVDRVRVRDDDKVSEAMTECVRLTLRRFSFKPARGRTTIDTKFSFGPE